MLPTVAIAVLAVNVVTFAVFGIDKVQARRHRRRIPEATLLALAWVTGAAGAWFGMSVFRHKTRKRSFIVKMVLVTLFNLAWPLLYLLVNRQ